MNVADLLRRTAADAPEKVALRYGVTEAHASVSFGSFDREVDRVAGGLIERGIEPGDRIAVAMGNTPHFAYAYLGILRAGAIAVPINVMLAEPEVASILQDCGARLLLASPQTAEAMSRAASAAGMGDVISTDAWDPPGEPHPIDLPEAGGDDLAVISYTSGTTGRPKGAMLSHANLLANIEQQMRIPDADVSASDVLLMALPLLHIFGLNVTLGLVIRSGATGVLLERFEAVASLRTVQDEKVSVIFGAPTMYQAWTATPGADQYELSGVRLAISGAAPLAIDTLNAFHDMFGVHIYEGYGLTETAPTLTSNRMAGAPRAGSVGKPLADIELRLVDDEGNDVELGDPGEIVVRGPNVFKGYWQQPEATREAFTDGWFRTGDVAVMDEDAYLYLVDRKRDLIIVSGFNVFPSEVEAALLADTSVAEAAVIGVPHPYTGEAVQAYVVLRPGSAATTAELLDGVSSRLARFKMPSSIEIVDALPHVVTGKVARRELRQAAVRRT